MEQNKSYFIRKMRDSDIQQVLEIDFDAFPTQWPHPTTSSFNHELRNKLAHYIVAYEGNEKPDATVAPPLPAWKQALSFLHHLFDHDRFFGNAGLNTMEKLVGMAGIWMMVDEAHIVTIAVRNSHRNMGLGEWMLIEIIDMSIRLGAKIVTLEVRTSNTTAQKLYEKYGFCVAGTRKRYYSDNGEDAYIMSTEHLDSESYQEMFRTLKAGHQRRWSHCGTAN